MKNKQKIDENHENGKWLRFVIKIYQKTNAHTKLNGLKMQKKVQSCN